MRNIKDYKACLKCGHSKAWARHCKGGGWWIFRCSHPGEHIHIECARCFHEEIVACLDDLRGEEES